MFRIVLGMDSCRVLLPQSKHHSKHVGRAGFVEIQHSGSVCGSHGRLVDVIRRLIVDLRFIECVHQVAYPCCCLVLSLVISSVYTGQIN